eukprot:13445683-Ditylum_brightwellii.AAC.1
MEEQNKFQHYYPYLVHDVVVSQLPLYWQVLVPLRIRVGCTWQQWSDPPCCISMWNQHSLGNEKRVLVLELSGRQNILGEFRDAGLVDYPDDDLVEERTSAILNRVKHLESI